MRAWRVPTRALHTEALVTESSTTGISRDMPPDDGSICRHMLSRCLVVAHFLPIPDAEFLPFYLLVLKLVVCVWSRRTTTLVHSSLTIAQASCAPCGLFVHGS